MLNSIVMHSKYGKGTIISIDDKYIKVSFESHNQLKKFIYPDSFEKYLIFIESELQKSAIRDYCIIQKKREMELEKKRLEFEKYEKERKKSRMTTVKKKQENIRNFKGISIEKEH